MCTGTAHTVGIPLAACGSSLVLIHFLTRTATVCQCRGCGTCSSTVVEHCGCAISEDVGELLGLYILHAFLVVDGKELGSIGGWGDIGLAVLVTPEALTAQSVETGRHVADGLAVLERTAPDFNATVVSGEFFFNCTAFQNEACRIGHILATPAMVAGRDITCTIVVGLGPAIQCLGSREACVLNQDGDVVALFAVLADVLTNQGGNLSGYASDVLRRVGTLAVSAVQGVLVVAQRGSQFSPTEVVYIGNLGGQGTVDVCLEACILGDGCSQCIGSGIQGILGSGVVLACALAVPGYGLGVIQRVGVVLLDEAVSVNLVKVRIFGLVACDGSIEQHLLWVVGHGTVVGQREVVGCNPVGIGAYGAQSDFDIADSGIHEGHLEVCGHSSSDFLVDIQVAARGKQLNADSGVC